MKFPHYTVHPSAIDSESLKPLSVRIALRIKTWSVAYLKFIIISFKIFLKFLNLFLCNFLVRTLQCFFFYFELCFANENMKKTTLKSCS